MSNQTNKGQHSEYVPKRVRQIDTGLAMRLVPTSPKAKADKSFPFLRTFVVTLNRRRGDGSTALL